MRDNKLIAIDLFCGVGGLTKGLEQAGINVVAGLDFEPSCQYAYEKNAHHHWSSEKCKSKPQ